MLSTYDSTVIYIHPYVGDINFVLKFTKIVTELVNEFAEIVGVDGEKVKFEIPQKGYHHGQIALKVVVLNDWKPIEGITVHGIRRESYTQSTETLLLGDYWGLNVKQDPPKNPHNLFGTM